MDNLKWYTKNADDLEGLLSILKWFRDYTVKQFGQAKCVKVTFRIVAQLKSENINRHINTEITDFEHYKNHGYFGINKVNGINNIINKEKMRKEFNWRLRKECKK